MHHRYIGLPQHRIPLCHNVATACFFGAICGMRPITTLTRRPQIGGGVHAALYFVQQRNSVADEALEKTSCYICSSFRDM